MINLGQLLEELFLCPLIQIANQISKIKQKK